MPESRTPFSIASEVSEKAKDYLAKEGYSPVYGARPLERKVEREVAGEAAVDPRPHACDQCHFQSLCRIAELDLITIDAAANDAEDADD